MHCQVINKYKLNSLSMKSYRILILMENRNQVLFISVKVWNCDTIWVDCSLKSRTLIHFLSDSLSLNIEGFSVDVCECGLSLLNFKQTREEDNLEVLSNFASLVELFKIKVVLCVSLLAVLQIDLKPVWMSLVPANNWLYWPCIAASTEWE